MWRKPMDEKKLLERVTFYPKIFGGKPVMRGRHRPVEHVPGMLPTGDTPAIIVQGYPWLEIEVIQACSSMPGSWCAMKMASLTTMISL
jgi:uncharacterized protein (DUF433 family)